MPQDEQKAATDCAMIFKYLLTCPNDDANPILKGAKHILDEKKLKMAQRAGTKRQNTQNISKNAIKGFCQIF